MIERAKGFADLMLAKPYDSARVSDWRGMHSEPKRDGVRVVILCNPEHEEITCHSRNGRQLEMFKHLYEEVLEFAEAATELGVGLDDGFEGGVMLDGEMVATSGDFGEIGGAIHRKEHTADYARFICFHVMPLNLFHENMGDSESQLKRTAMIAKIVKSRKLKLINYRKPVKVDCHEDVLKANELFKAEGHEGSMVKDYLRPWVPKRVYTWMKIKDEKSVDVTVVDMKKGTGKYSRTLGALIVSYKGKKVRVSGMTDKQRDSFFKNPETIVGKMVEVEYQEETPHGSLRHPRFKRFRDDKEAA